LQPEKDCSFKVCTLWKNANTMQGSKEKLAQDIFKYLDYIEKNYSNSRFTGFEYLFRCKTLDLAL
jgi:hypothetical protein